MCVGQGQQLLPLVGGYEVTSDGFLGDEPSAAPLLEAEKGHRDRLLPMTPDFAEWLLDKPEVQRAGRVFKLVGLKTGKPITEKRVSRIVSTIGKRAAVVVNEAAGKFASAHDRRRAFGTRWAGRVKPATLQLLMRHENIETTLSYYAQTVEMCSQGTYVNDYRAVRTD